MEQKGYLCLISIILWKGFSVSMFQSTFSQFVKDASLLPVLFPVFCWQLNSQADGPQYKTRVKFLLISTTSWARCNNRLVRSCVPHSAGQTGSWMVPFALTWRVWLMQPSWHTYLRSASAENTFCSWLAKNTSNPQNTLKSKANATDVLHKELSHASNFIHQYCYPCSAAYNPKVRSSLFQAPGVTSYSLEMLLAVQIIHWMKPLCWPAACTWLFPLTLFGT